MNSEKTHKWFGKNPPKNGIYFLLSIVFNLSLNFQKGHGDEP